MNALSAVEIDALTHGLSPEDMEGDSSSEVWAGYMGTVVMQQEAFLAAAASEATAA